MLYCQQRFTTHTLANQRQKKRKYKEKQCPNKEKQELTIQKKRIGIPREGIQPKRGKREKRENIETS